MRQIIIKASTVEKATEEGCKKLGLEREQVTVEILEMPVKKFFKSKPAKVCLTEIEIEKPANKLDEKINENLDEHYSAKPKTEQTLEKNITKQIEKENKISKEEPKIEIDIFENEQVERTVSYLQTIFNQLGAENVEIKVYQQGVATLFEIKEGDISSVFVINGDTIQSLSYLLDRVANHGVDKKSGQYLHVRLDISGYRDKREKELTALANKVGAEVKRTHKNRTLPPMNSYERLIVHTVIGEMDELISESVGQDGNRRVVIKSTADDAVDGGEWRINLKKENNRKYSKDKNFYNRNKSQTSRREYKNTENNTETPTVPKVREALNDADDLPLYGKIDL